MSDMDLFDPVAFFENKIGAVQQELIEKRTHATILEANRKNLERTLTTLATLEQEQQKAIQMEITALSAARTSTQRSLEAVDAEIVLLLAKLDALRAAQKLVLSGYEEGRPA